MSVLTRGFGPGGGLISRGQGVVIRAVEAIATYTAQTVKKATRESIRFAGEVIDTYKVTVSLISVNGEEFIYPATSTKRGSINRSKEIMVSINNFAVSNVYKPAYKIVINVLNVAKGII
jgi:hypothetical protein